MKLKENEIQAVIHFPIPVHLQPAFSYLGYNKGSMKIAEALADNIISLPMFPELTTEQIKDFRNFYNKKETIN